MKKLGVLSLLAVLAIYTIFFASCDKRPETVAPPETTQTNEVSQDTQNAQSDTAFTGTVTFLCGSVRMTVSGSEVALDIGANVPVNATVETDADAICEIKFADFGSVHIDSSSSLCINKLMSDATHTESELGLKAGKVVCKVRKLAGDDSFQIRTPEMVCGVRGTVFQVARKDNERVKIAVDEGSVAVYPPSIETVAALPETVSETVQDCAPVVAAGEEAAVTAETAKKLDAAYADIVATVEKNPEAEVAKPMEQYRKIAATMVTERVPVSDENQEAFKDASTLEVAAVVEALPKQLTVSVTVEPADAITTINGMSTVKGSFSGSFEAGKKIDLRIEREGYESATESIMVDGTSAIIKTVSLVKKAEDVSRTIPVSASKLIAVCASGDGSYLVSDAKSAVSSVGIDGSVRWTAKTGNGTNALNPPVYGDGVVAFAGDKALSVFDAKTGKQLWTLALDKSNTGLYGRHPVIAKGKLFLAGDSGITVYDAKTGAASGAAAFADGSDMSPAFAAGMIHIVSKSGAWYKINADTLAIAKSLDTGALQPVASAPAVFGGTVVFANRKGTVTAINAETGAQLWQAKLEETKSVDVFTDPVIASGGVYLYAKGTLYALDLATGKPLFAPIAGASSPARFAAGHVWYGSGTSLVAISPANASVAKKLPTTEAISGSPLLTDQSIVVPLASGKLFIHRVD